MTTPPSELAARLEERAADKPLPPCRVCGAPLSLSSAGGGSLPKYNCSTLKMDFSTGAQSHYNTSEHFHDHGDPDVIALLATVTELEGRVKTAEGVSTETLRDAIHGAYLTGAEDVHRAWIDNGPYSDDPDFAEAAGDYVADAMPKILDAAQWLAGKAVGL